MADKDAQRPIIIKRKVVSGDGHHGGAWKVAYADFVTAMMAFFLLMWLINATTEEQRGGIADYFSPDIPLSEISAAGADILNGESLLSEEDLTDDASDQNLVAIQAQINEELDVDAAPGELTRHLKIRMTPDGLRIDIVDLDNAALFESGSASPSALLRRIVGAIAPIMSAARNRLEISGHTDAAPFASNTGYSNWELSSDRAHAARRLLLEAGVPADRTVEVSGRADIEPLADDPLAAENRRIAITLLHPSRHPLAPPRDGQRSLTETDTP